MKQLVFLFTFIGLCASMNCRAQLDEERHTFAVGFNGGLNMSSVNFDPKIKQNKQNGMSAGATLRYITEKYFSMICGVQVEVNYSQRGWNEKIEDESGMTYSRSMNYIEIPFMAHLAFGKDDPKKGMQFFINAGPQFSFFLSDKEKMSENFDTSKRVVNEQYGKAVDNKFEYGIVGGAGFDLNTKLGHFILEGRYFYGLADFFSNDRKDYFGRSAHSYIGVRAAYLFDIFK